MSRDDGGHWLPIHTGLLRDERFLGTGRAREAWLVLYLALDGEPESGWFRDRARVLFLLQQFGVSRPDQQVAALEALGWLIPEHEDSPRLTIRRWGRYTGTTGRKGVYNRDRDTSRVGRQKPVEHRRSPVETGGDLDETRRDEKPHAHAHEGPEPIAGALKRAVEAAGFDPKKIGASPILGQPGAVVE